ncbi:MAG: pyruvate kinase [Acidobacteriota bacterium]
MIRRAKIIATLGPSSSTERTIERILRAGADLIRLNLSHGNHGSHREYVTRVRRRAQSLDRHIPVIFDLMGPRYRIGEVTDAGCRIRRGQTVRLGSLDPEPDLPIDDPHFLRHLQAGERILIDNGLIELKVVESGRKEVKARVVHGGTVASRKGINLPDSELPFQITDKDRLDIELAVELGVDFIAASYVGRAEDVEAIRREVLRAGASIPIVAKLERGRAVSNIVEITDAADAVMVARGDLGVEVQLHRVPVLQKQIVEAGRRSGTPVIVATQMLDSMMSHPRPTRAETSDVANAVFDGADALLLTGETAAGNYPVKAVQTMVKIIKEAEAHATSRLSVAASNIVRSPRILPPLKIKSRGNSGEAVGKRDSEIADAIARAAVETVQHLGVRQIVAFSQSGFTARLISRYRPDVSILAFTPDPEVARSVQIYWGVRPFLIGERVDSGEDVVTLVEHHLLESSLAKENQNFILLMAEPLHERALTNLLRVQRVRRS